MDKITEHHYRNIAEGKTVDNPDGTLSTVKTATVEYDGLTYLIPTVWDGEILELEDAEKRAFSEGVYETFENETEARRFDALIHEDFFEGTTSEEAEMALSKADSRKGIITREGEVMADKKFQLDENKADTDGDGEVSSYEKEKAEAIQKSKADKDLEVNEMYCGGLMDDEIIVGMDMETGNPIPPGSSAENVKDDIPAALSTGEYVLPADVVRWHGLKHIQMMMDEAKMGLMSMHMDGQIKDVEEEEESPKEKEDIETPEGNKVEVAEVEVEIEEMDEEDKMKDEEDYSKKKKLPSITSTPNVMYMTG